MKLPSLGRKSQIDYLSDGSVKKTYNQNDDPAGKFRREVGFYRHYERSRLIPTLLGSSPDAFIVIERVTGDLMHDVDLTTGDLASLSIVFASEGLRVLRGEFFRPSPLRSLWLRLRRCRLDQKTRKGVGIISTSNCF